MIQSALQTGIVSYAGLSRQALFAMAREAVSEVGVPERFAAFLPLFPFELIQNMSYYGPDSRKQPVNRLGFSIDPAEYFRKLYEQTPQLFAGENRARNFDYEDHYVGRGVLTVDAVWVAMFPQYKAFQGEKLVLHMLGDGSQGAAAPESLAVRGGGVLRTIENTMQVTARAKLYGQYTRSRVDAGEGYDAEAFGAAFLKATGLSATSIGQAELGRTLQGLAIFRGLSEDEPGELFTQSARRGGQLRQYTPNRYGGDPFEPIAVTRHTARLAQLADGDFISDLWIPYEELAAYIDREQGGLDAGRLCRSYQIAPTYDPETFGGRYPGSLRVAVLRDRDVELLSGAALNNPAYGDGMSPQGTLCRHLYLPGSAELLRQRKLAIEEHRIPLVNLTVDCREYLHMLALAALQEHKGKLTDALYRREAALSQLVPGSRGYEQYRAGLDERVRRVEALMASEQKRTGANQMSGYDADIDYLRRKSLDREGVPEGEEEPIAFVIDGLRESSVESGYAMRGALLRVSYDDLRLPLTDAAEPDAAEQDATADPGATGVPAATTEPDAAAKPDAVAEQDATAKPDMATEPAAMAKPDTTAEPAATTEPATTAKPDTATEPDTAAEQAATAKPAATSEPDTAAEQAATAKPATAEPDATEPDESAKPDETKPAVTAEPDANKPAATTEPAAFSADEASRAADKATDAAPDEAARPDASGKPDEARTNAPSADLPDEPPADSPADLPDESLATNKPDLPDESAAAPARASSAAAKAAPHAGPLNLSDLSVDPSMRAPGRMADLVRGSRTATEALTEEPASPARPMREILRQSVAGEAAHNAAPDQHPAPAENPAPAPDEGPAATDTPAPDEAHATDEAPAAASASAATDTPAPDEAHATDEAPAAASALAATDTPAADEAPAGETAAKGEQTAANGAPSGKAVPRGKQSKANKKNKKQRPGTYEQLRWPVR